MSDPLEQLSRFRSEIDAQGAPMLSAAEVRRQGDRKRRRTTAVRAGVAALALAVVAVPLGLALDRDHEDAGPTGDPNQVVHGVSEADLLTDADTVAYGTYHWQQTSTHPSDGNVGDGTCTRDTLDVMGATSTYRRDWVLADDNGPLHGTGAANQLSETIGAYPSPAAAQTAVESLAAAIAGCGSTMEPAQHYHANRPRNLDTGNPDDLAMLIESNYVPDPAKPEDGRFVETGLVATGDRVAVVTMLVGGQDFNVDTPPVQPMVPKAAERLLTSAPASPSGSGPAAALTQSMLVGAGDVPFQQGLSWYQTYGGTAETQAPFAVCAQEPLAALGATSAIQRDYRAASVETGDGTDVLLDESIGAFATEQDAIAAVETIAGWYRSCRPSGSTGYTVASPWSETPAEQGVEARSLIARYGPADAAPGSQYDVAGRNDLSWFLDVSIIRDGTKVAILTQNALLQRYDTTSITTTAQDVAVAVQRLRGEEPASGTGGTGSGTDAAGLPTTIPPYYPLAGGWENEVPENADSVLAPSRQRDVPELQACGRSLPWPAYVDRRNAGFHNPEDVRDRTIFTYADADAAATATKAIVDFFRACPTAPEDAGGYTAHWQVERSDLSGDSWHISQYDTFQGSDALGATAIHVIRRGLAVLVISWSGEGTRSSLPDYFTTMDRQAAGPIEALCTFTAAGC